MEPIIGHMKSELRLERNRLKGTLGNAINALLNAAAMNFGKFIKWMGQFWLFFSARLKMIFREPASSPPRNAHFFGIDE